MDNHVYNYISGFPKLWITLWCKFCHHWPGIPAKPKKQTLLFAYSHSPVDVIHRASDKIQSFHFYMLDPVLFLITI